MNHLPADNLHEMSSLIQFLRQQQASKVLFLFVDRRIRSALLLRLGYCKHNLSTQTQEIIYWIHDKVICCGLYEAFKTVHQAHEGP